MGSEDWGVGWVNPPDKGRGFGWVDCLASVTWSSKRVAELFADAGGDVLFPEILPP